ncbi:MAG: DUF721 domain-containing protein [Paracoccaceae bacterium]
MLRKSDVNSAKGKPKRYARGFVQTGGLLHRRIRSAGEKRGFAEMRLLTHWVEVVGKSIAAIAQPVKVSYAREGFGATLTVLTDGARAPELQMLLPSLREKVNACYGYNAISRIRITQTAGEGFAEPNATFKHENAAPKTMSAPQANALKSALKPVKDDSLRRALEMLGHNVLKEH